MFRHELAVGIFKHDIQESVSLVFQGAAPSNLPASAN